MGTEFLDDFDLSFLAAEDGGGVSKRTVKSGLFIGRSGGARPAPPAGGPRHRKPQKSGRDTPHFFFPSSWGPRFGRPSSTVSGLDLEVRQTIVCKSGPLILFSLQRIGFENTRFEMLAEKDVRPA